MDAWQVPYMDIGSGGVVMAALRTPRKREVTEVSVCLCPPEEASACHENVHVFSKAWNHLCQSKHVLFSPFFFSVLTVFHVRMYARQQIEFLLYILMDCAAGRIFEDVTLVQDSVSLLLRFFLLLLGGGVPFYPCPLLLYSCCCTKVDLRS